MFSPSSFGAQVAAIMDVLAKAAVAEITKLVEDGSSVLRVEMSRKEGEIQELRASLKLIEAELRKAQEAAASRQAEDKRAPTAENQSFREDKRENLEMRAAQNGIEESQNIWPVVKHEPEDEHANAETEDNRARADVCVKAEQDDSTWPACSMFERNSVAMQQHIQISPSHADQYSDQRNAQSSYNSSSCAAEVPADVPGKVEVETRPVCMEGITSESVHNKEFRRISPPAISQSSQQSGPSLPLPHVKTSTAISTRLNTEDLNQTRDVCKSKRVRNVCSRSNQKVYMCSVCSKSFSCLSQLEKHTHQSYKPFRCLECGKSFTQKARLKTHQRVHTGERPYCCKICGKMFSRRDNCLRHERFHSGLKPYSCRQCDKSFTMLDKLKIHQEIHLNGR